MFQCAVYHKDHRIAMMNKIMDGVTDIKAEDVKEK